LWDESGNSNTQRPRIRYASTTHHQTRIIRSLRETLAAGQGRVSLVTLPPDGAFFHHIPAGNSLKSSAKTLQKSPVGNLMLQENQDAADYEPESGQHRRCRFENASYVACG